MEFNSFSDFVAMSGYGAYVWFSFLSSLALLVGCWWHARRGVAQLREKHLKQQQRLAQVAQFSQEKKS